MTMSLRQGFVSHVQKEQDIPTGKHWAILVYETIQRSTGYQNTGEAEDVETITRYHVFTDEASWKDALQVLTKKNLNQPNSSPFTGIVVEGKATVSVDINVKVA